MDVFVAVSASVSHLNMRDFVVVFVVSFTNITEMFLPCCRALECHRFRIQTQHPIRPISQCQRLCRSVLVSYHRQRHILLALQQDTLLANHILKCQIHTCQTFRVIVQPPMFLVEACQSPPPLQPVVAIHQIHRCMHHITHIHANKRQSIHKHLSPLKVIRAMAFSKPQRRRLPSIRMLTIWLRAFPKCRDTLGMCADPRCVCVCQLQRIKCVLCSLHPIFQCKVKQILIKDTQYRFTQNTL